MADTKHTPTPWNTNGNWIEKDGETIGQAFYVVGGSTIQGAINATFIVRAVNAHDLLVAALNAQEALSKAGLLNARDGEMERVRNLRHAALAAAEA